MADQTWLDVMPAIPLARGVPVVRLLAGGEVMTGWFVRGIESDGVLDLCGATQDHRYLPPSRVRVDLADPQGFGYALRHPGVLDIVDSALVRRHLYRDTPDSWGPPTEEDKMDVAKACAEVQDG